MWGTLSAPGPPLDSGQAGSLRLVRPGAGWTHDSVLHAEAQLVLEVRPLDEHCGDRGTADDVQLHLRLLLQPLQGGVTGGTGERSREGSGEAGTSGLPSLCQGEGLAPQPTRRAPRAAVGVWPMRPLPRAEAAAQGRGPGCDAARTTSGTSVAWGGAWGVRGGPGGALGMRARGRPIWKGCGDTFQNIPQNRLELMARRGGRDWASGICERRLRGAPEPRAAPAKDPGLGGWGGQGEAQPQHGAAAARPSGQAQAGGEAERPGDGSVHTTHSAPKPSDRAPWNCSPWREPPEPLTEAPATSVRVCVVTPVGRSPLSRRGGQGGRPQRGGEGTAPATGAWGRPHAGSCLETRCKALQPEAPGSLCPAQASGEGPGQPVRLQRPKAASSRVRWSVWPPLLKTCLPGSLR